MTVPALRQAVKYVHETGGLEWVESTYSWVNSTRHVPGARKHPVNRAADIQLECNRSIF
jgi:hypothetical protein